MLSGIMPRIIGIILFLIVMGGTIYGDTLSHIFHILLERRDASHGYLVPFIAGYMIWYHRERFKGIKACFDPLLGIILIGSGLVLFFLFGNRFETTIVGLSYLTLTAGALMFFLGRNLFKVVWFPLVFLVTLVPLPENWYFQIGIWMRHVSMTSVRFLQMLDYAVFTNGFNVSLPNCEVEVVHGCSGVRYLIPFFILGLSYAYLYKETIRGKVLTVLSAIPLALLAGFLRILFVLLAIYYFGCFMAGQPHIWISWAVFGFVVSLAVLLDVLISRWAIRYVQQHAPFE